MNCILKAYFEAWSFFLYLNKQLKKVKVNLPTAEKRELILIMSQNLSKNWWNFHFIDESWTIRTNLRIREECVWRLDKFPFSLAPQVYLAYFKNNKFSRDQSDKSNGS